VSTPIRWGPSAQGRSLLGLAAVALGSAVAAREPSLLALATPALWSLLTTPRTGEPDTADVVAVRQVLSGEEGADLTAQLTVTLPVPAARVDARLAVPSSFDGEVTGEGSDCDALPLVGDLVPRRWGRHRLGPVRVDLLSTGGLRSGRADVRIGTTALVRPRADRIAMASAPAHLPNRLGEHPTRVGGHGVEPIAVRAFAAGDPVRRINWRVSSRRQELHVTVASSERAVDLVLVIDALSDVGGSERSSLDASVRAATGVAERWLRARDRVGVVVLGGRLRWLGPTGGSSHVDRVAEAVLWSWPPPGAIAPDVHMVPRSVVPSGSVVLLFTPLLEAGAVTAVAALRERSSRVLVVDVLGDAEPHVDRRDLTGHLALRLWRLERAATISRLRSLGTPVLAPGDADLDRLIALALRGVR
jgi:uncharacterized protein (DUF58 family)